MAHLTRALATISAIALCSERKVGGEAPVAGGNWYQPARSVYERGHGGSSDLDCRVGRSFQILGGAACVKLIGAWDAIAKRDILGHIVVERGGSGRRRADEIFS